MGSRRKKKWIAFSSKISPVFVLFLLLLLLIFVVNSESGLDVNLSCGALAVSYAVKLKLVVLIFNPFIFENL